MERGNQPLQGSLFEENYLLRTLGSIASSPEIALTELVVNAWDAGASIVRITIPSERGEELVVEDDGTGMTPEQFRKRWMTLGYDRTKHQGKLAEFPAERMGLRRRAYGKDGAGRHSLLCFADKYQIETRRDSTVSTFTVAAVSGQNPFVLLDEKIEAGEGHGTRLSARVKRNLPKPEKIGNVLSGRFLSDPQFSIFVNGDSIQLTEHKGLIDRKVIKVTEKLFVEALFFSLDDTSKRVFHHGVAFWVGGRLAGEPTWTLGDRVLLDGRTRFAKRHTVVVRSDDLFEFVLRDWSGFGQSTTISLAYKKVGDYVIKKIADLAAGQIQQTKEQAIRNHREEIKKLRVHSRHEIAEAINHITNKHPTLGEEYVSIAVEALIKIEKARTGAELMEKLSQLSEEDVDGLNRLLSEWTIRDALTVLDEVDRRIAVIEAIDRLSSDPKVDELQTLHPLVSQARWLFGPEFDSPEYASNVSLVNAVKAVFKKKVSADSFINYRKRPDLIILEDASLSIVGIEGFDGYSGLARTKSVLLIELKRGASIIGRKEIHQASDYVEDLLACGHVDGRPFINAFVVGHRLSDKMEPVNKIGDPDVGRVEACTYPQLVRTAGRRLFNLRDHLRDRYEQEGQDAIMDKVLSEPRQLKMHST